MQTAIILSSDWSRCCGATPPTSAAGGCSWTWARTSGGGYRAGERLNILLYKLTITQNHLLRYENFLVCNYGVGGNKAGQPLYRHPDCGNTGELLYCAWVDNYGTDLNFYKLYKLWLRDKEGANLSLKCHCQHSNNHLPGVFMSILSMSP